MSIDTPDVSVVIPTRDRAALLLRALRCVASQTLPNLEVIVVDDGDDAAAEAARSAWPRVTTLSSERAGQVAARNRGVAAARGRRIAFLDDDDWWADTGHLTRMVAAAGPLPCLVYASGRMVYEGDHPDAGRELPFEARATAESLRRDNQILVSGMIYDRALHAELGPFDPAFPYYWDWDWYLRLAKAGIPFRPAMSNAVRIAVSANSVSAEANRADRAANLRGLAAKHDLGDLRLRNHDSIARDGNRAS